MRAEAEVAKVLHLLEALLEHHAESDSLANDPPAVLGPGPRLGTRAEEAGLVELPASASAWDFRCR